MPQAQSTNPLKIAVAKGRVAKQTLTALKMAGYALPESPGRALRLLDDNKTLDMLFVKSADVPTYVELGVVDVGIVGKDVIDEKVYKVYELMDLGIGKCQLCLAGFADFDYNKIPYLKIASKYPTQSYAFMKAKGIDGQVIPLEGSVELGPIVGLSDCIIDIVETGTTLKENNLQVIESIKPISSRLIANKIRYKTKTEPIVAFMDVLKTQLNQEAQ